jgi:spiro-SPASM protein
MGHSLPFFLAKDKKSRDDEPMKTLCVVLTYQPVVAPDRPLAGRRIDGWVQGVLDRALAGVLRKDLGPCADPASLVTGLQEAAQGYDEVVLVPADAPFLRADLITEMLDLHREFRADYTFADGYPGGWTPEIFRPSVLEPLASWATGQPGPVTRETLFQLLSTDINRFDVETLLSPVDLRGRRLSFTADSLRGRVLLDRYADDAALDTRTFLATVESSQERTRTLPATLHVQVTDGVIQVPEWSPLLQFVPDARERRNFLDRNRWNALLDRALDWAGDLTVLPSFWGEPSLHPQIVDLIADALTKPGLRLCIETSGLGWASVDLESLAAQGPTNLDWIVELDSDDPATYRTIRGEGFSEAHALTKRLLKLFPGRVWPQTVRTNRNEGEMEGFYKHWKEEAGRVIIQKHNDFGGRLPRAKPSDLSPWKRQACWHLARDLAVFLDGTAVVCREDFDRTQPLGNLWHEEFSEVWARGTGLFAAHARGEWPGVCRNCDEWYTFHF